MVAVSEVASSPPSTSPSRRGPCPRTPPSYPDLYGKYRLQKQIQVLNRELGFLEEELSSLDGLPPASRFCKEVEEFVREHPDPLVPIKRTIRRSRQIWRTFRVAFRCNISCLRCSSCCSISAPKKFDSWNVTRCWRWCCATFCCTCKLCCTLPSCPDCKCYTSDCTCALPGCSCAPECGCSPPDCCTCCKLPTASCRICGCTKPDCSCCIPECRCSLPDCSCCIPNCSCCICSCPKCPRISCRWLNSTNICCIPSWLC
ncbi:unnamed protein product [Victoria cruziana]